MRRSISLGCLIPFIAGCTDHSSGGSTPLQALGTVAFESRLEIDTGVPRAAASLLLDVDGDGLQDLVAVDQDGLFAVRINQGGGSFATAGAQAVGAGAFHLSAADLDFDGDLDLVCASLRGTADVLVNDGNGTFSITATIQVGANPIAATLARVDADDILDLVVLHQGTDDVLVFAGIGDGNFVSPEARSFDRSANVAGLSAGDLDGDGRAEIVCCDLDRDLVTVLPGNQLAPIQFAVAGVPIASNIGDVDGDGVPEIAVAVFGGRRVDVFEQRLGGFALRTSIPTGGQPFAMLIDDVDGDGAHDLLFTLLDRRSVVLHRGVGGQLSDAGQTWVATGSPVEPQLADLDGDGMRDLFVPAFGLSVANLYRGRPGGLRGGRLHDIAGLTSPENVHAADIDGDGRADVIAASFSSTVVKISELVRDADGDTALRPLVEVDVGLLVQNVVPADLDRDGRVDFVVAVEGGVRLIHNLRPVVNFRFAFETLPPGGVLAPGAGPFEIAVDDLDADGALDLVIAYHEADKVALLRGTDTPFEFAAAQETRLTGRPVGIATGDFDGDGRPELAVGRLAFAAITTLEVTEAGLVALADTPVGAGPFFLRTADFDRDGRMDVVLSEVGTEHVRMLISDGSGSFRATSIDAGQSPTALLTRDLNRDGLPDIVVASLVGADFHVLLGDGLGGVSQALRFPGVYGALTADLADVDGDGLEDLVIGSLQAQGVALFHNVSRPE